MRRLWGLFSVSSVLPPHSPRSPAQRVDVIAALKAMTTWTVWTVLCVMMGIAAYLVWRRGLDAPGVRTALMVFLVQLALNGVWSLVFFELRQPGWALVEIVVLWLAIGVTAWLFRRVAPAAALLLLPYWAWVSFATVLNAALWWLNR